MMPKPEVFAIVAQAFSSWVNGRSDKVKIDAESDFRHQQAESDHEYRMARMTHEMKLLEFVANNDLKSAEQLNAVHEFINALK